MEDVKVKLSLDASQFEDGVGKAEGKLGSLKGKMGDIGKGLQSVGTKMAGVGAGMVASIGGIVAAGAKWSASVESTNFLYKNLDKSVQKSIETNMKNAKSLGMTEQQYKSNATSLSTFLGNMGFANEEISNMSGRAMELAADLGALADVPIDQAMGDFKSALMGNYEALDKYGVNISAATLENSEYVKSLGKTWNQLSDNEKMMAVWNEVLKQSSSAQGLAKQESESFNSQMRLLKDSIGETVGALGEQLLPILEPVIQKIQEVVDKITNWIKENPEAAGTILQIVGAIGAFLAIAGTLITIIGVIAGAVALVSAVSLPVVGIIAGIVLAVMALVAAGIWLAANWDMVKEKAIEVWEGIKQWISDAVQATSDKIKEIWTGIKDWCSQTWESIKTTATTIWEGIKNSISNLIQGISDTISEIWNGIKNFISSVCNGIKTIITNIWNGIKSAISTVVNGIKSVITTVFNGIKSTVSNIFNGIKSTASNIWNGIKSVISNAVNGIKDKVSQGFNGLKDTVSKALEGVKNTAKKMWDSITGIFSKPIKAVVNFVKGGKAAPLPPAPQQYSNLGYSAIGAMSSYSRSGGMSLGASGGAPVSFSANMNTNVQLDGKTIAKASAPYMRSELDKLNKRQNRLGGR